VSWRLAGKIGVPVGAPELPSRAKLRIGSNLRQYGRPVGVNPTTMAKGLWY
jgi:hypothetical protein